MTLATALPRSDDVGQQNVHSFLILLYYCPPSGPVSSSADQSVQPTNQPTKQGATYVLLLLLLLLLLLPPAPSGPLVWFLGREANAGLVEDVEEAEEVVDFQLGGALVNKLVLGQQPHHQVCSEPKQDRVTQSRDKQQCGWEKLKSRRKSLRLPLPLSTATPGSLEHPTRARGNATKPAAPLMGGALVMSIECSDAWVSKLALRSLSTDLVRKTAPSVLFLREKQRRTRPSHCTRTRPQRKQFW